MAYQRRYIHEETGEEDLWIDLSILRFLREEMLLGNLDYVSLREPYKQGIFSSEVDCSWERFRRRALYQIGLGFAEPRIIYGPEGERIDSKKHTGYLCSMRVTPSGFMQIGELENEIKKYEGWNRYFTKVRKLIDKFMGMKGGFIISLTTLLIICIFTFDIKVSEIIQKIPILSSVINTTILEQFEAINTQDEFYRALMTDSELSSRSGNKSSSEENTDISTGSTTPEEIVKPVQKENITPKIIQKLLPENAKIEKIVVRSVSPLEKVFKVTLSDGSLQLIQVKKEDGKYIIVPK